MDKNKLKSKMILNGDTGSDLAEYLSISRTTLSSKMNNNGSEFTQGEILKIKEKYNLTGNEIDEIFFSNKVS